MTHIFDEATSLDKVAPNRWSGQTNPAYGNLAGPFGGTTSATLLRAILSDAECVGQPVNQSVNFCGAIGSGPFETCCIDIGDIDLCWRSHPYRKMGGSLGRSYSLSLQFNLLGMLAHCSYM